MNKIFSYIILFLFFYNITLSSQLKCNFQEVYQDGQIQNGILFLGSTQIRYQYNNENLFTLIYHNNGILYSVSNQNSSELVQINHNKEIFKTILDIKDNNNISETLHLDGMKVDIEKNKIDKFVKRLAIKSKDLNMSIFFIDCIEKEIDKKLFYVNPFYEYSENDF